MDLPRPCLLAALLLTLACADDPTDTGVGAADGGAAGMAGDGDGDADCGPAAELAGETPLPAEIADIFERRCWSCHSDPVQNYAPMPLTTWEQVQAPRHETNPEPNYVVIGRRIHSESFPMPPEREPQLSTDDLATLDAWIADCAPAAE